MTIVAVILAVALIVAVVTFTEVVRSLVRQQARERDLLLNQMLNLAGRPWQTAPAEVVTPEPEPEDNGRFVLDPAQLPDY